MKLDRQKPGTRHRLLSLHSRPPSGQFDLPLQTVCCRSDLAGECRRTPRPDIGQFLWRPSAVPRNLTFAGSERRRVSDAATSPGHRLLPLAATGRCRPTAAGDAVEMLAAKPTWPINSWRTLDSGTRRLLRLRPEDAGAQRKLLTWVAPPATAFGESRPAARTSIPGTRPAVGSPRRAHAVRPR